MVSRLRTHSSAFIVSVEDFGKLRRAVLQDYPEPPVPRDAREATEVRISRQNRFQVTVVLVDLHPVLVDLPLVLIDLHPVLVTDLESVNIPTILLWMHRHRLGESIVLVWTRMRRCGIFITKKRPSPIARRSKVAEWVLGLPLLMHLSVIFFFLGFIMKLWSYHQITAYVVTVLAVLLLVIYMGMTVMAAFREMCPYHNTAMMMVPKIFSSLWGWLGAAGGWMLKKIPISILRRAPKPISKLAPDVDLEKGSVSSVSSFPLYRAHPRSDREEDFVEKNSKEFKWNMVAWLLTTCRRPSSVDLALKSIRTLPYVPRKAYDLLSTRIPQLLHSKILTDGEDISMDDEDWRADETYEFMLSFIYLLKCIALDGGDTSNLTSLISLPTTSAFATYGRLDEAAMQVWATYKTADPPPEQEPLPAKNFVALISMETLFYHLHPQIKKQDDDPMIEMHALLDRHVTDKAPLDGRSLALLLDSLVYVLPRMTEARVRHTALCLLVRVVRTLTEEDSLVFRPMASCFRMLIDGDAGTTALREHIEAPREPKFECGPGSGYRALFDVLGTISRSDVDDALKSDIVWGTFSLASSTMQVEVALSEPILRDNCAMPANKFVPEMDVDEWSVSFFTEVFSASDYGGPSEPILRVLGEIITSLPSHPDAKIRDAILESVLKCLKTCLLTDAVAEQEKSRICRSLFRTLKDNIRHDESLFLIHSIAERRWLVGLDDILTSVKSDVLAVAQELVDAWSNITVDGSDEGDSLHILEVIFMG